MQVIALYFEPKTREKISFADISKEINDAF